MWKMWLGQIKMNIIAIDQSLNESGYWINEKESGIIVTKEAKTQFEKIILVRVKLTLLYDFYKFDTLIMEDYSYGSMNTRFTFTAGELGGMIKMFCFDRGIKLYIVSPSILKKFICGKGNAKKEQMLLQLYKKTGREFSNNNIADAYALYLFFMSYRQWLDPNLTTINWTKIEKECFEKFHKLLNVPQKEDTGQDKIDGNTI